MEIGCHTFSRLTACHTHHVCCYRRFAIQAIASDLWETTAQVNSGYRASMLGGHSLMLSNLHAAGIQKRVMGWPRLLTAITVYSHLAIPSGEVRAKAFWGLERCYLLPASTVIGLVGLCDCRRASISSVYFMGGVSPGSSRADDCEISRC